MLNSFVQAASAYKILYIDTLKHIQQYPDSFNSADKYIKDPEFGNQGSGLAGLLITPVQRGPRYRLLIEEASKHNEKDALLIHMLEEMGLEIKEGLNLVNEAEKPYQFGDYTKSGLNWLSTALFGGKNEETSTDFVMIEKEEHSNKP